MVVLLIYERNKPPLTLVAHGHDGQTHFAVADSPSQRPDPRLVADVLQMLYVTNRSRQNMDGMNHTKRKEKLENGN
jgi:hypothetical protein